MGSTPYVISDTVSAEVYLPNRPHNPVTVLNQGPGTAYLSDVDVPSPATSGHPLAAGSTIVWDRDRALFLATDGTCTVVVTDNAGAIFDASAIASQILQQGLPDSIAQQISVAGVPTIDAAQSLLYTRFLTAGPGGSAGQSTGGGGGGGTDGSGTGGTGTPSGFVAGVSGAGANDGTFNAWIDAHDIGAVATWADSTVERQQSGGTIGPGQEFGAWTGILNIAVGGIFSGDSWSGANAGAYDSRWTTCLQAIKTKWGSRPPANLHIRFAHEFNGNFSAWKVSAADAPAFRGAFARFAKLQRQIIPGSVVVWSPNYGTSSLGNISDAYPGDAWVDVIGPDWYNQYPHVTSGADFIAGLNYSPGGNPQGLGAWLSFCASHGKPMCLPECGNPGVDGGGGAGGGDAPGFATEFIKWCKANGGNSAGKLWYAIYFNISSGYSAKFSIFGDGAVQPQTAAVFKAGW